eukprot:EG_transcript_19516
MLRPSKKAAPKRERKASPQDAEVQEKIAQGQRRREEERQEQRVRYPEDEEAEEEERRQKEAAGKLTKGTLIFNAVLAVVFVSLPLSDDDYKGAALMAAFNVFWTFVVHGGGWLDYAVLIGTNALLSVYANKIVTEYHRVPGLLPPEQWAVLLISNGSILFAYWWRIIRKAPEDERETHWNIITLALFALDCAIGIYFGFITVEHMMTVLGRMKNLLLTGAV